MGRRYEIKRKVKGYDFIDVIKKVWDVALCRESNHGLLHLLLYSEGKEGETQRSLPHPAL